jgi:glycosyltransferase involved in cell wall biosynthesis
MAGLTLKSILMSVPYLESSEEYKHPGGQLTAATQLVQHLRSVGINVIVTNTYGGSYPPKPLILKIGESLSRIITTWKLIKENKIDVYFTFSGFDLSFFERIICCLIARAYSVTSLVYFRNSTILSIEQASLYHRLLTRMLSVPTALVSQGTRLSSYLGSLTGQNVHVVKPWLSDDYSTICEVKCSVREVRFVFVGWLEKKKGVIELIEAIVALNNMGYLFKVDFVGGGSLESTLKAMMTTNNLTNVTLHGWLEPDKVKEIYRASQAFILPSYNEGFPNSLLEAMSFGLAPIVTPVGGIPDVINGVTNGMLVEVMSATSIIGSMEQYILDHELLESHAREALNTVRRDHRVNTSADHLVKIIENQLRRLDK